MPSALTGCELLGPAYGSSIDEVLRFYPSIPAFAVPVKGPAPYRLLVLLRQNRFCPQAGRLRLGPPIPRAGAGTRRGSAVAAVVPQDRLIRHATRPQKGRPGIAKAVLPI